MILNFLNKEMWYDANDTTIQSRNDVNVSLNVSLNATLQVAMLCCQIENL